MSHLKETFCLSENRKPAASIADDKAKPISCMHSLHARIGLAQKKRKLLLLIQNLQLGFVNDLSLDKLQTLFSQKQGDKVSAKLSF